MSKQAALRNEREKTMATTEGKADRQRSQLKDRYLAGRRASKKKFRLFIISRARKKTVRLSFFQRRRWRPKEGHRTLQNFQFSKILKIFEIFKKWKFWGVLQPSFGLHRLRCKKMRRTVFFRALESSKSLNFFLEAPWPARFRKRRDEAAMKTIGIHRAF